MGPDRSENPKVSAETGRSLPDYLTRCLHPEGWATDFNGCRLMPLIGAVEHPSYCLMDAEACCIPDDKTQCGA